MGVGDGEALDYESVYADTLLAESWTLDVKGAPDVLFDLATEEVDGYQISGAYALGMVYVDSNGNGALDAPGPGGDQPTGATACTVDGTPVAPLYLSTPTSTAAGLILTQFGFTAGWNLMIVDEGEDNDEPPGVVDPADYGTLVVNPDCSL